MRKLYLVSILCLIIIAVKAQTEIPFKGANRIVFVCSDSTEMLYKRLGKHLMLNGYSIEADKDFLNIKTKDRDVSGYSVTFKINSVIQENKIFFTISVHSEALGVTMDWYYKKMETFRRIHDYFLTTMREFKRDRVYYEKF